MDRAGSVDYARPLSSLNVSPGGGERSAKNAGPLYRPTAPAHYFPAQPSASRGPPRRPPTPAQNIDGRGEAPALRLYTGRRDKGAPGTRGPPGPDRHIVARRAAPRRRRTMPMTNRGRPAPLGHLIRTPLCGGGSPPGAAFSRASPMTGRVFTGGFVAIYLPMPVMRWARKVLQARGAARAGCHCAPGREAKGCERGARPCLYGSIFEGLPRRSAGLSAAPPEHVLKIDLIFPLRIRRRALRGSFSSMCMGNWQGRVVRASESPNVGERFLFI